MNTPYTPALTPSKKRQDISSDVSVRSIVTRATFDVSPERAWETIMFYEQIDRRPPFYLRLLLPAPVRTEGDKSTVGDEAFCVYEGGHLIKRVREIEPGRIYRFDVVDQQLAIGRGVRLMGGEYVLEPLSEDRTEIRLATRYTSRTRPRWLWQAVEKQVCHMFHRYILSSMRRSALKA